MKTVSIWLVPKKEQEIQLQDIINNLSGRYGAYSFIPHITLYRLDKIDPHELVRFAEEQSKLATPIALEFGKIAYSDIFTKTLYAQFKINFSLQHLYDEFKIKYFTSHPYELSPHLSLIYKNNMKNDDKEKEIKKIILPEKLYLDRIAIIIRNGSIEKEEDVLEWKNVGTFCLGRNLNKLGTISK